LWDSACSPGEIAGDHPRIDFRNLQNTQIFPNN
jgi:hypothetical protein